ncbi:MAG TPA: phosphotransferase [Steroidobacteraceae bacterium]|nr:phosphotransferase [Steroidobacteraceae bacterium]
MIPAEALALIPGCEDGRPPLSIAPLPGGRACNQVLRVDTAQGRFVWRRRLDPVDRPGSRAADEWRAQRLAAAAGLAPAILAAHPRGHWLLMEFIDAPMWTAEQLHSETGALRLGRQLGRLHELQVPAGMSAVDPTAVAADYLARLMAVAAAEAAELAPLRDRVAMLDARIAAAGTAPVLNHGDLMASNMLGAAPRLVDWEYAQLAGPGWDLACLLTYYPGMARFLPQLLAGSGLTGAVIASLEWQRERFELLNRLWERLAARGAG